MTQPTNTSGDQAMNDIHSFIAAMKQSREERRRAFEARERALDAVIKANAARQAELDQEIASLVAELDTASLDATLQLAEGTE